MQHTYEVYSNLLSVGTFSKLNDAKHFARNESLVYDDVHTIAIDGLTTYMAQGGQLYRLTLTN